MIPLVPLVVSVAAPLDGWLTMVNEAVLTDAAPPLTRVSTLNWLGGEVEPGV